MNLKKLPEAMAKMLMPMVLQNGSKDKEASFCVAKK